MSPVASPNDLLALLHGDLLDAAKGLLGCELRCGDIRARIVETEAYGSEPGSHAYRGRTPRNAPMFGPPGRAYVYLNYGVHWLLNVSCRAEGEPGAILIRACQPLEGIEILQKNRPTARSAFDLLSGPGKLTQAIGVNFSHNASDLLGGERGLALASGQPAGSVLCGPRIGLRPGLGDDLPWRFVDAVALDWVSVRTGLHPD